MNTLEELPKQLKSATPAHYFSDAEWAKKKARRRLANESKKQNIHYKKSR